MKLLYACLYRKPEYRKCEADWEARNLIACVKGNPQYMSKSEFTFPVDGTAYPIKPNDRAAALSIAAVALSTVLGPHLKDAVTFVPMPSSSMVDAMPPTVFPGKDLSDNLTYVLNNHYAGAHQTFDAIRWNRQLTSSSHGGTRSESAIFSNIKLILLPPLDKPIWIVDDVKTTGAHLCALKRHFEAVGYQVSGAVVVGMTEDRSDLPAIGTRWEVFSCPDVNANVTPSK